MAPTARSSAASVAADSYPPLLPRALATIGSISRGSDRLTALGTPAPGTGALPVSISKRMTPSEKRSARYAAGIVLERSWAAPAAPRAPSGKCRQPEIGDFRVAFRRDDNRVGGDRAVHEVGGVRVGERLGDLARQVDGAARIERPAADDRLQRLSLDELVDEIQPAVVFAHFIERHDVRVRYGGRRAGVPEKMFAALRDLTRSDPTPP